MEAAKDQGWTCKKCTLVNNTFSLICDACGASKLRSLALNIETTLPKEDMWTCKRCTLKNPVSMNECKACRTIRSIEPCKSGSPKRRRPKKIQNTNVQKDGAQNFHLPKEYLKTDRINLDNYDPCK